VLAAQDHQVVQLVQSLILQDQLERAELNHQLAEIPLLVHLQHGLEEMLLINKQLQVD
jgi:hypothetical protein